MLFFNFKKPLPAAFLFPDAAAFLLALLLTACVSSSLDPQQRLWQAQEQQARWVEQCDAYTALQMRQLRDSFALTSEEREALQGKISERFAEPAFQACYRLAIENEQKERYIRHLQHQRDADWFFTRYGFGVPVYGCCHTHRPYRREVGEPPPLTEQDIHSNETGVLP